MAGEIWARLAAAAAGAGALAGAQAAGWAAEGQAIAAIGAALAASWLWPRGRAAVPASPAVDPGEGASRRRLAPRLGFAALERLPVAVLLIDRVGRIVYANPAATALFERLAVNEHYSASFRAPDFLDSVADAMERGAARDFDFSLHGDRTRHIAAHVDAATLRGAAGAERYAICMFLDRTQEVRLARLRTDFVANASHELRTPLSSVKGFIETLQGPAREDAEARDRFLGIMQAQAERMERLVDDLLSLSRIELNEHIAPSGHEDFGEIAKETAEAMAPLARRRGVDLNVRLDGVGPVVRGDRDQLSQAVGNLIENALKYGGGKPVALLRREGSETYPGLVGIAVQDEGEGLSRDDVPRVTERFYRVSVKRSRDQGGTGLGLAIVKHILSRHRGDLEIESAPGEGSRFTLWLPPADDRAKREGAEGLETAEPTATADEAAASGPTPMAPTSVFSAGSG